MLTSVLNVAHAVQCVEWVVCGSLCMFGVIGGKAISMFFDDLVHFLAFLGKLWCMVDILTILGAIADP